MNYEVAIVATIIYEHVSMWLDDVILILRIHNVDNRLRHVARSDTDGNSNSLVRRIIFFVESI